MPCTSAPSPLSSVTMTILFPACMCSLNSGNSSMSIFFERSGYSIERQIRTSLAELRHFRMWYGEIHYFDSESNSSGQTWVLLYIS